MLRSWPKPKYQTNESGIQAIVHKVDQTQVDLLKKPTFLLMTPSLNTVVWFSGIGLNPDIAHVQYFDPKLNYARFVRKV